MKKNLLLGLMALTGLFTSCSKDDVSSLPTDQSNMVSMKVEMPADFAKTRAVPTAPANHKLRCILEVWDKDGTDLKVRQEQIYTSGDEMTFTFDLSDQAEYKAVLWADYIASDAATSSVTTPNAYTHYGDKYYKTNDATGLKKVTIIESAYTYTEQLREAFTGVTSFTKAADALEVPKVTLTRPLTKLTIAEKNATTFALCSTVKATYDVPSEFNALTETVGAATYAATYNAAPTGTDMTISSTACKALFTDYVFTASDATVGGILLEFTSTGVETLASKEIPAGIPLKRNYQINAAGNLIVSEGNPNEVSMTVDMKNDWVGTEDNGIPERAAANGDFYYSDGTFSSKYLSAKTCIGIVVTYYSDGATQNRIVSLVEGTDLSWGAYGDNKFSTYNCLQEMVSKGYNWDDFPAFKWVAETMNHRIGGGWESSDRWYLPRDFEIIEACSDEIKAKVNASLALISGATPLDGVYWSSTEYVGGFTSGTSTDGPPLDRSNLLKVRAMSLFNE